VRAGVHACVMARVITQGRGCAHAAARPRRRTGAAAHGKAAQGTIQSNNTRAVGTATAPARKCILAWHEGRHHTVRARRRNGDDKVYKRYNSPPLREGRASTDEWGNGSSPRWPQGEVQALVKEGKAGG
jgi:hypothetical protein